MEFIKLINISAGVKCYGAVLIDVYANNDIVTYQENYNMWNIIITNQKSYLLLLEFHKDNPCVDI